MGGGGVGGRTGNSPWALPERANAGWIWLSAAPQLLILSFRTADQPDRNENKHEWDTEHIGKVKARLSP